MAFLPLSRGPLTFGVLSLGSCHLSGIAHHRAVSSMGVIKGGSHAAKSHLPQIPAPGTSASAAIERRDSRAGSIAPQRPMCCRCREEWCRGGSHRLVILILRLADGLTHACILCSNDLLQIGSLSTKLRKCAITWAIRLRFTVRPQGII